MVILSKNNPTVKELSALKDKKYRKERGAFLVEGEKMVRECAASGLEILRLAVREDYHGDTYGLEPVVLGADAFQAVADEKTPQGILAEVKIPVCPLKAPTAPCLVLDGVSDPANFGAIVRTALAAGYREIYCISCTDGFSPKSVRASMSGIFFVKLMSGSREEVLSLLEGVPLFAADMGGENAFLCNPPKLFALAIGNEGNGLSPEVRARATKTVRIPMGEKSESLNAAVSAGILMYLLKKKNFERL